MLSGSTQSIQLDLNQLGEHFQHCHPSLEEWVLDEFVASEDEELSSDVDILALSQDIDCAMREIGAQYGHTDGYIKGILNNEDFQIESVYNWDLMMDHDSMGDHLMEVPESPNFVDTLISVVPGINDLSSRLKPKLIQDPFIDEQGQPYSIELIFRADRILDLNEDHIDTQTENESVRNFNEAFSQEPLLAECDSDIDPLFEITITEEMEGTQPLSLNANHIEAPLSVRDQSPDQSLQDTDLLRQESSKDLETLTQETGIVSSFVKLSQDRVPDFSPSKDLENVSKMDFSKLNNHDVSNDSDDSGIGHALLESPILTQTHTCFSPTLIQQVSLLEPLPMSPDKKIVLLSPKTERKLKEELWRGERAFDTILAHTLPYPDTCEGIHVVLNSNLVSQLTSLLEIENLQLDRDLELDLPWDPLAPFHCEMDAAKKSLDRQQPAFEVDHKLDHVVSCKRLIGEVFHIDESISEEVDNAVEWPVSMLMIEFIERSDVDSDIPTLGLKQTAVPPHSNTLSTSFASNSSNSANAPLHQKDVAWNLLMQSSGLTSQSNHYPISIRSDAFWKGPLQPDTQYSIPGRNSYRSSVCDNRATLPPTKLQQSDFLQNMDNTVSPLETFLLLRSSNKTTFREMAEIPLSGLKRGLSRLASDSIGEPLRKKPAECIENEDYMKLELIERVATPTYLDVCLSGDYLSTICRLEQFATELYSELYQLGFRSMERCVRKIPRDSIMFYLKQQQKALKNNHDTDKIEYIKVSCQLAASLYLACSVVDALFHCSLGAGLGRFASLFEKHQELLGEKVVPVKKELLALHLSAREDSRGGGHPKLHELVRVISKWRDKERASRKEKAVVIVDTEFPSLSGEILDYLQSIPDLKSCVFSFLPDATSLPDSDNLYQKAIEERFNLYDCLVVSLSSLTIHDRFPWDRVSLLIEYEQLTVPLFGSKSSLEMNETERGTQRSSSSMTVADRLHLRKYISLRTVQEISTMISSELFGEWNTLKSAQFTLVASERITANTQLLQLLETRHNILIIERDFSTYYNQRNLKWFAYADLIIDETTGVLVRPLSILDSDQGVRTLINTVTALSFQFERCWILLYTQDRDSYPYAGEIPFNLSRLHASIAHYCPKVDEYTVKVNTVSDMEQVSYWIRRISDETYRSLKECHREGWLDRDWIETEMIMGEKTLLSFPCLNTFSALQMLREASLGDLLRMPLDQLTSCLRWLPHKVIKIFHGMCHLSAISDAGETQSSSTPNINCEPVECQIESKTDSLPEYTACCSNVEQSTAEEFSVKEPHCFTGNNHTVSNAPRMSEKMMWATNFSLQSDIGLNHSSMDDSLEELDYNEERTRLFDDTTSCIDRSDESNHSDSTCVRSYPTSVNVPFLENSNSSYFKSSAIERPNCTAKPGGAQSITLRQQASDSVSPFESQDDFFTSNPVSFVGQDMKAFKLFPDKTNSSGNPKNTSRSDDDTGEQAETNSNSSWIMELLSSSKIVRQHHTQKQIKQSATNSTYSFPNTDNFWPRLTSSTVRGRLVHSASANPIRTPVKSLDLGFGTLNNPKVYLQSNDRVFPCLENSCGSRTLAIQSRDDHMSQQPSTETHVSTSELDSRRDSIVPSQHMLSSPNREYSDSSLYDSPANTNSPTKRRITYKKDPHGADGQTKLMFF